MRLIAFFVLIFASAAHAEDVPVFTQGDEGRAFLDVYASGLYSATCVEGAGCTCTAMPIDREELAVVLGLTSVSADTQGLWSSPASEEALTSETSEALHQRFGGTGYCPQAELLPEDGLWQDGKPFNIVVQCGPVTEMFRQVLANQKLVTARLEWNEVFSGDTIQTAFMAADPDPEYTPHAFKSVTPVETVGTALMTQDGATMTSTGRMQLLTSKLFAVDWTVQGATEMGPCNWSTRQLVTWVGE